MDFVIACMPWVALFFAVVAIAIVVLKVLICRKNNKLRKEYELKQKEAEKIEVLTDE